MSCEGKIWLVIIFLFGQIFLSCTAPKEFPSEKAVQEMTDASILKKKNKRRKEASVSCRLQAIRKRELADEPTWRCHLNPFVGALGIQEPVILGEPQI